MAACKTDAYASGRTSVLQDLQKSLADLVANAPEPVFGLDLHSATFPEDAGEQVKRWDEWQSEILKAVETFCAEGKQSRLSLRIVNLGGEELDRGREFMPTARAGDILDDIADRIASYERDLVELMKEQRQSVKQWQGTRLRNIGRCSAVDVDGHLVYADAGVPLFRDLFGSEFALNAYWRTDFAGDEPVEPQLKRRKADGPEDNRKFSRRVGVPYIRGELSCHMGSRFRFGADVMHLACQDDSKKVEIFSSQGGSIFSRLFPKFKVDLDTAAPADVGGFLQELLASRRCSVSFFVNVIVGPNMGQDFRQSLKSLNERYGAVVVGLANGNMPRAGGRHWPVLTLVSDDYVEEGKQLWALAREKASDSEIAMELHVAWSYVKEEEVCIKERPLLDLFT